MTTNMIPKNATLAVIAMAALLLGGCESEKPKPAPMGNLTHHLRMVGNDGKQYGTVELDPVGGGRILDADGKLIGTVVKP